MAKGLQPPSPCLLAQVPYVGASVRQVEHVLSLLRGRSGKLVDLGSGDGRIVSSGGGTGAALTAFSQPAGSEAVGAHRCWLPTDAVSAQLWAMS